MQIDRYRAIFSHELIDKPIFVCYFFDRTCNMGLHETETV
jgi:hypothetical protein